MSSCRPKRGKKMKTKYSRNPNRRSRLSSISLPKRSYQRSEEEISRSKNKEEDQPGIEENPGSNLSLKFFFSLSSLQLNEGKIPSMKIENPFKPIPMIRFSPFFEMALWDLDAWQATILEESHRLKCPSCSFTLYPGKSKRMISNCHQQNCMAVLNWMKEDMWATKCSEF